MADKAEVEDEENATNYESEEFIPRSPVPLPDASLCKSILVQLGFSLSKKEKKGTECSQVYIFILDSLIEVLNA